MRWQFWTKFFEPRILTKTIKPRPKQKSVLFYNPPFWRVVVFGIGTGLLLWTLVTLFLLYSPLLRVLLRFYLSPCSSSSAASAFPPPISTTEDKSDFYLAIPKIQASGRVYPEVSPFQREEYLKVLQKGVAHAAGSGFPGQDKTIYLFAHSTDAPVNIVRYNAVFFLLNKLERKDPVFLFYNGQRYQYQVREKKILEAKAVEYLRFENDKETLVLQTCWPPGTTWKRLLVFLDRASPF